MNIWYINNYGGGPGIGRQWRPYHLAKEWGKHGHDTTVFVADYHHLLENTEKLPSKQFVDGIPYIALRAGKYKGNGLGRILNLTRFCISVLHLLWRVNRDLNRPDAIIVSSPHPFAIFPAKLLAKRFNARLIFEVRDLWPLSIVEVNGTSRWHPFVLLTAFAERFAYRNADLVASLLPSVELYMQERQMVYKKFVWVPNGIGQFETKATNSTSKTSQAVAAQMKSWRESGNRVLFHPGSIGPANGLTSLVLAIAYLNDRHPNPSICAVLVGDGIERAKIEDIIRSKNLGNIRIFPPISKSEVQTLLRHADIGYVGSSANSSIYRYGVSPNKALDYIANEIPFVCALGEVSTSFSGYPLALYVESGNHKAIAEALLALTTYKSKKGKAMESILNLGYSTIAAKYLSAINSD